MGAYYNDIVFDACDAATLKKNFAKHVEDLKYENGNDSYAGHLGTCRGLVIYPNTFKDSQEAQIWVENKAEKWGPAIAVQVGDFKNAFPSRSADKNLYTAYLNLKENLDNWDANLLKRVKAAKSLQKTCTKCSSKISVSYLKSTYCPVCTSHDFLETPTDKKKRQDMVVKMKDLTQRVEAAKKEHKAKIKPAFWYVGGWCAS